VRTAERPIPAASGHVNKPSRRLRAVVTETACRPPRLADQRNAGTEALGQEDQRQMQPAAATAVVRTKAAPVRTALLRRDLLDIAEQYDRLADQGVDD
jgi:hypothetical protein